MYVTARAADLDFDAESLLTQVLQSFKPLIAQSRTFAQGQTWLYIIELPYFSIASRPFLSFECNRSSLVSEAGKQTVHVKYREVLLASGVVRGRQGYPSPMFLIEALSQSCRSLALAREIRSYSCPRGRFLVWDEGKRSCFVCNAERSA